MILFFPLRPLIEESNGLREKRLNESKAAASSSKAAAAALNSPESSKLGAGPVSKSPSTKVLEVTKAVDIVDEVDIGNSGTMIQRSGSSSMIIRDEFGR